MGNKNILVTGGAGYIGSHTCKELSKAGFRPVVVDNLIYGHEWAVQWGPFYKCDLSDTLQLNLIFEKEKPIAVIHFAAFAYVGESVHQPLKYYNNNVAGTLSLLSVMSEKRVDKIVFSSTCATYGVPLTIPIDEDEIQKPVNPYGKSKLMVETVLKDLAHIKKINAVALRYFNAAGADIDLEIGEEHNPETHLIPNVISAALSDNQSVSVFGDDYPTKDGTCLRDYIHVNDLANAHVLAVNELVENRIRGYEFMNLGTGVGTSVFDIIKEVEKIVGKKIKVNLEKRREGDPAELVAKVKKAEKVLGWKPMYSDLKTILSTAIGWHKKHF